MKIFFLLVSIIVIVACISPPTEGDMQTTITRTNEVIPSSNQTPTSTMTLSPTLTSTITPNQTSKYTVPLKPTSFLRQHIMQLPDFEPSMVRNYMETMRVEKKGCEYFAIYQGYHGGCFLKYEIDQKIEKNTIMVTLSVYSDPPAGWACHLHFGKFVKEFLLETKGLVSGIYIVDVNGVTARLRLDSACAGWQFP